MHENKTTNRYFCTGTAINTFCTHFWYISTLKRSLIEIMRGKKNRGTKAAELNLSVTTQWTILWAENSWLFRLDQEASGSTDPEIENKIQETSSNLTQRKNQTTSFYNDSLADEMSMTSRRRRRGIGRRPGGGWDWWYGNWCGHNQGGYAYYPRKSCRSNCYTSNYAYVSTACRRCFPPIDGLDAACMEHDR